MKAEHVKNTGIYVGRVFRSGRKKALEPKMASKHALGRRKTEGGTEKVTCKSMERDENHKKFQAG
jgi:hypothetical protein